MPISEPHTLSDGTTLRVREERSFNRTVFTEIPSRVRRASVIFQIGNSLYLDWFGMAICLEGVYVDCYRDAADAARKFFIDSAESVIAHAASEGIDVASCY